MEEYLCVGVILDDAIVPNVKDVDDSICVASNIDVIMDISSCALTVLCRLVPMVLTSGFTIRLVVSDGYVVAFLGAGVGQSSPLSVKYLLELLFSTYCLYEYTSST